VREIIGSPRSHWLYCWHWPNCQLLIWSRSCSSWLPWRDGSFISPWFIPKLELRTCSSHCSY
jgi:hypothetical protein